MKQLDGSLANEMFVRDMHADGDKVVPQVEVVLRLREQRSDKDGTMTLGKKHKFRRFIATPESMRALARQLLATADAADDLAARLVIVPMVVKKAA